ncbi:hypothetical protein BY996DRAFT_6416654 [Phakopsora pachyrhizi]|nr:hypothetical protein BY996DRAFT_6420233 [Phakopsora pachyrhizi]KAI8451161.1 hypothetical protein BY996DRAFT_6416654 [Phakopsora pachyrhizi]
MLGWFKRKLGRPSRTYSDGYLTQPRFTQSQDSVFEAAPASRSYYHHNYEVSNNSAQPEPSSASSSSSFSLASASASLSPVFEPVISPKKNKTIQNPPVKSLEEAPKNYQGLAERYQRTPYVYPNETNFKLEEYIASIIPSTQAEMNYSSNEHKNFSPPESPHFFDHGRECSHYNCELIKNLKKPSPSPTSRFSENIRNSLSTCHNKGDYSFTDNFFLSKKSLIEKHYFFQKNPSQEEKYQDIYVEMTSQAFKKQPKNSPLKSVKSLQLHSKSLNIGTSSPPLIDQLSSRELLIETISVGVDQWDLNFLITAASVSDHGKTFIPGRSFFGKVIGLGKRVKRTKKGDLVYGLQDYSKSGILAEQIKVSEDLVARAPSFIGLNHEKRLTADQVACLPLLAVPAFLITSSVCEGLPKGSKIMILNGHKGVGRLMLRMINNFRSTRDLWVTTHVPASGAGNLVDLDRLCSELQQEGARDVVVSENVVELLESEHECSYDAILDTIGGRSIYDGCRRLLHHHGLFATSVGEPNEGILKPRMRALRRQFFKKGSKHLAYWCVNPLDRFDSTEPQEIRLVLETVTEWIESGYLRGDNIVGDEVTFKKSAQVFIESLDTLLSATNSSDIVVGTCSPNSLVAVTVRQSCPTVD